MQGRPPPESRLPRSLPGAAGDTGRGPFRRGPGRPATQRAGRPSRPRWVCTQVPTVTSSVPTCGPLRCGGNDGARSRQWRRKPGEHLPHGHGQRSAVPIL